MPPASLAFMKMFTTWHDGRKNIPPLLTVNLCEMDSNCGNLMKLASCVRFPFIFVLLREQLGFFSQI